MTPHIEADKGQVAPDILLPGDPLRAKYIAENYLTEVEKFNSVRNMLGYTGKYNGEKVSIMGTGMGIPSFSIYATELIDYYDVKRLIRVGSCGSYTEEVKVKDILLPIGASTDSNMLSQLNLGGTFSATPDFDLLKNAYDVCKKYGVDYHIGNVLTSDVFYDYTDIITKWSEMGILGVEMETYALFTIGAMRGVDVLSILTVSDSLITNESLSPSDREQSFDDMVQIALETLQI